MSRLAMAATIEIESGIEGDPRGPHRVLINGTDVSIQVRSVDFHIEGGEPADVRVTFAHPKMTLKGLAKIVAADSHKEA